MGAIWSAPPCKEFSRLKLRRPGPKALRTPQHMDGVPGLTPEEQRRVDQSTEIHRRSRQLLRAAVQSTGFEQPPSAMSWLQEDNIALLREWAARCSWVPACQHVHLAWTTTKRGHCARHSHPLHHLQVSANTHRDLTKSSQGSSKTASTSAPSQRSTLQLWQSS